MQQIRVISRYTEKLAFQLLELHQASLPNDIIPNLVLSYYKYLVSLMANRKYGLLLGVFKSKKLLGFCFVAYNHEILIKKISEKKFFLLMSIFKFIFLKPQLIIDLLGSVFGKVKLYEHLDFSRYPEIFVMCISENHRSKGIGSQLIKEINESLLAEGHQFLLVKTSSDRAANFYLKEQFLCIGAQNRLTRKLKIFKRKL
tara:strand:+ start:223 stop:822 length:600 start_codon:yes stop_codon:yes gene_type:complete